MNETISHETHVSLENVHNNNISKSIFRRHHPLISTFSREARCHFLPASLKYFRKKKRIVAKFQTIYLFYRRLWLFHFLFFSLLSSTRLNESPENLELFYLQPSELYLKKWRVRTLCFHALGCGDRCELNAMQ